MPFYAMRAWAHGLKAGLILFAFGISSGFRQVFLIAVLSLLYFLTLVSTNTLLWCEPFLSGSGSMCFDTGWVPTYCYLNLPTTLQLNFVLVTIIFKSSSIIIDTFYAPFRLIRLSPSGRDLTTRQALDVRLSRQAFCVDFRLLPSGFVVRLLTSDS